MYMKRVLVTGASNIGKAGVATIVYKWGQCFDSNRIVYDYLMQSGLPEKEYIDAIRKKGGKIYTRPNKSKNYLKIIVWIKNIINNNDYEILHINADTSYLAAAYILAAKWAGISNIYVHSHCTNVDERDFIRRSIKTIFHYIFRPYVCRNSKCYLACSDLAADWMFGEKNKYKKPSLVIPNGIEVDEYLFDIDQRKFLRKELGLQNKFVIGNIGRLSYQKNQNFLIDVFYEFHRINPKSILVIVGDGELKARLKEKVNKAGLNNNVLFLGFRNDIPKLLSAFDCLVMPSRFEGLPVTMVEAQWSSLPCVVSAAISTQAKFSENVIFVKGHNIKHWIDSIESVENVKRTRDLPCIYNSDFNIHNSVKKLENVFFYQID